MSDQLLGERCREYEAERADLAVRRMRTACLLAVCLVPLYVIADYTLYPAYFASLLRGRLLCGLLVAGVWALTRTRAAYQFADLLGLAFGFSVALAAGGVPVILLGYAVPYSASFIIVIFGVALLLPWRAQHVAALAFILIALCAAASVLHGAVRNWPELATSTSFLVAATAVAMVSVNASEHMRRRDFQSRHDLRDAHDAKAQLVTALAEKTTQVESVNREMDDLLYAASHDLRAPLINIQGFSREFQAGLTQLRSGNGKSPEVHAALTDINESLQFILTAVNRMDVLIASLLNVSRVATRTNATQFVDLNALVGKLADSFHYQLSEQRIALEIDPLPTVTGDPILLAQLFGNLLDNAIKYMGACPERRITVGLDENGERRFFVRDTGPGIPKDAHDQVFRLFRRLANGNPPGEGIGLTLVRKIVEKHGGKIWLDSAPGRGTTFWFTLRGPAPVVAMEGTNYARA